MIYTYSIHIFASDWYRVTYISHIHHPGCHRAGPSESLQIWPSGSRHILSCFESLTSAAPKCAAADWTIAGGQVWAQWVLVAIVFKYFLIPLASSHTLAGLGLHRSHEHQNLRRFESNLETPCAFVKLRVWILVAHAASLHKDLEVER